MRTSKHRLRVAVMPLALLAPIISAFAIGTVEFVRLSASKRRVQNRSALKGCKSTRGFSPVTNSAISRPVIAPSVSP